MSHFTGQTRDREPRAAVCAASLRHARHAHNHGVGQTRHGLPDASIVHGNGQGNVSEQERVRGDVPRSGCPRRAVLSDACGAGPSWGNTPALMWCAIASLRSGLGTTVPEASHRAGHETWIPHARLRLQWTARLAYISEEKVAAWGERRHDRIRLTLGKNRARHGGSRQDGADRRPRPARL